MSEKSRPNVGKAPKTDKSTATRNSQTPRERNVVEKRGGQTSPNNAPVPPRTSKLPEAPPSGKKKP
jgi:hypothetical protein